MRRGHCAILILVCLPPGRSCTALCQCWVFLPVQGAATSRRSVVSPLPEAWPQAGTGGELGGRCRTGGPCVEGRKSTKISTLHSRWFQLELTSPSGRPFTAQRAPRGEGADGTRGVESPVEALSRHQSWPRRPWSPKTRGPRPAVLPPTRSSQSSPSETTFRATRSAGTGWVFKSIGRMYGDSPHIWSACRQTGERAP